MAQKIAPAALRLQTNKHFDAFWFADRMYDTILHQTLQTKLFVHTLFSKTWRQNSIVTCTSYTTWHIYSKFLL